MLASFLFSVLAGFATTRAEPWLCGALARLSGAEMRLDPFDSRILAFCLLMLLAAAATAATGADSSAYLAVSGGLLGYFAADILAFLRDPEAGTEDDDPLATAHEAAPPLKETDA